MEHSGLRKPSKFGSILKIVEIAFSIDDVGARFEYQRSNAIWTEVNENIQRFKDLKDRCRNIRLQICCTVNVFNVYYLETVAQWIAEQGLDYVYWNMMHDPYYFGIASLPVIAKQAITDKLAQADVTDVTRTEFARIVDFMNGGANLDGDILRMRIANFDRIRNENFNTVAPEFAQILNYNGPA